MADNVERTLPISNENSEISSRILEIIFEFALNKVDDSVERLTAGTSKFLPTIDHFVNEGKTVELCLPAFPFKSANKVYKVFGILPDKGEELALERLNRMCERIRGVYKPGAKLTILSDGVVYNGMLSTLLLGRCSFGETNLSL
uniref:Pyoverdine/dityrosine biosynthesis protein n=1 Tax=Bionectria ochroleuca TaxID=29856 RepID=A0A8H7TQC1_BIOOC